MNFIDFLPLISAVFVFYLGLVVFWKDVRARINFTFFLLVLAIVVWLFGTFMMFVYGENKGSAIFWDRFVYSGVIFIPVFMYHFNLAYSGRKRNKILVAGYILSFLFLFLNGTEYFVDGVFHYQWGVHTKAQLFHHLFLVYFFILILRWFVEMIRYYRTLKSKLARERTKYVILGFLFLFVIGFMAFLPAYGLGIYPFAYVSGVIFAIILAYAILKHKLFNLKAVLTEMSVVGFSVLLLINLLFFSDNIFEYVPRGFQAS